jgi:hypothetical protein
MKDNVTKDPKATKRKRHPAHPDDLINFFEQLLLERICLIEEKEDGLLHHAITWLAKRARRAKKHRGRQPLTRTQLTQRWQRRRQQKREQEQVFAQLRIKYQEWVANDKSPSLQLRKSKAMKRCVKEAAAVLKLPESVVRREGHFAGNKRPGR